METLSTRIEFAVISSSHLMDISWPYTMDTAVGKLQTCALVKCKPTSRKILQVKEENLMSLGASKNHSIKSKQMHYPLLRLVSMQDLLRQHTWVRVPLSRLYTKTSYMWPMLETAKVSFSLSMKTARIKTLISAKLFRQIRSMNKSVSKKSSLRRKTYLFAKTEIRKLVT